MTENTARPRALFNNTISLTEFVSYAGALALIGASIALNIIAALDRGTTNIVRAAWVATSIGADLIKASAPLALFGAGISIFRRSSAAMLLMITLSFGAVNALGYSRSKRAVLNAEAVKIDDQRNTLEGDRARLEAKAINAKTRTERDQAEAGLAKLRTELARLPADKQDASASAIADYSNALGYKIAPAALAAWLSLLPVLLLEVGSALALLMAQNVKPVSAGRQIALEAIQVAAPLPAAAALPLIEQTPVVDTSPSVSKAAARIAELARKSGGSLQAASQRALAREISVNPGSVNRALAFLVSTGAAVVALDNGVSVAMVAA